MINFVMVSLRNYSLTTLSVKTVVLAVKIPWVKSNKELKRSLAGVVLHCKQVPG